VVCQSDKFDDLFALAARIVDSDLQPSAMEIFSPVALGLSDTIDGAYAIAIRFLDDDETIESEVAHLARLSEGSRSLSHEDANLLWESYRDSETDRKWVWSLRVSVLPTDVPRMVHEIQELLPSSSISVHAANGIIRVFDETQALDQLKTAQRPRKVAELRRSAQEHGGQLVILRAPASILEKLDVWGEVGQTGRLMRELKAKFDPLAILNPGRFVNGI
jgi:FAD/FMN-containing dehydrogenase